MARVPIQRHRKRQRGHSTHRIHTSRATDILMWRFLDVSRKFLVNKAIQEMRSGEAKDHGGKNRKKIALQDVYLGDLHCGPDLCCDDFQILVDT